MSSLYLGKIGGENGPYEIHALTKGLPFREFSSSEIADLNLFQKVLSERFNVLEGGRPIYCTAVNPDLEKRIETNPHDEREGTVHIVSLDTTGQIVCSISVAVDTGDKVHGEIVGLPLENRYKQNGYAVGADLAKFRDQYLRLHYNKSRSFKPYEMAELYRHFRSNTVASDDISARIGLYTGCYYLFNQEAINRQITPTWIWVFDAIPAYFKLYRLAGAAMLRDLLVGSPPQKVSPRFDLKDNRSKGAHPIIFRDKVVSRIVKVPFPSKEIEKLLFTHQDVHFLDGVVDTHIMEKSVVKSKGLPFSMGIKHFGLVDKIKLRVGLTLTGEKHFKYYHAGSVFNNIVNTLVIKYLCSSTWDFENIGTVNRRTIFDALDDVKDEMHA